MDESGLLEALLQVAQRRTGQKFTVRRILFQGPRPVISGSPNIGDYGGTITIQTPDALTVPQSHWYVS